MAAIRSLLAFLFLLTTVLFSVATALLRDVEATAKNSNSPARWTFSADRRRIARNAPGNGDSTNSSGSAGDLSGQSHDDIADDLRESTFNQSFKDDDGSQMTLAWVGNKSGVVLALTARDFNVPFLQLLFDRSKLYISTDYGKTYKDITGEIGNGMIRNDHSIISHPLNPQRVVLLTEKLGHVILYFLVTSNDGGLNFEVKPIPFAPMTKFSFHPINPDVLVCISLNASLFITKDFGITWRLIHSHVITYKWAEDGSLYLTSTGGDGPQCKYNKQWLRLQKSINYGDTFLVMASGIQEFGVAGHFMYASVLYQNARLALHISIDGGKNWNIAQLAPSNVSRIYAVLWYDEDMLFMHVDDPEVKTYGSIYTSDKQGIIFSKSLDRHFFTTFLFNTDFTPVASMKGVYITTRIAEDNRVQSRITFNRGGQWQPILKPKNVECKADVSVSESDCALQIHGKYTILQDNSVPQLLLSEQNAIGLIIAHGNVGASLNATERDVYLSEDGGYTWSRVLQGPHYYSILDSGGLIVAVPFSYSHTPGVIHFSTDAGQTWHEFLFSPEKLMVKGLVSEPGAKSTHVSVWGHHLQMTNPVRVDLVWVSYTIDFGILLKRNCTDEDFEPWLAHWMEDPTNQSSGCVLGVKRTFHMLKKNSSCLKGPDYFPNETLGYCPCTEEDYMCDFGYYKDGGKCLEEWKFNKTSLFVCLTEEEQLVQTEGYRKVPGDKCQGGVQHNSTRKVTSITCTHTLIKPYVEPMFTTAASSYEPISQNNHGGVIALVVLFVLVIIGALVVAARRSQAFKDRCNSIRYLILREEQVNL
ncbi:unnamed protein product [Lampetra fluviatilis]